MDSTSGYSETLDNCLVHSGSLLSTFVMINSFMSYVLLHPFYRWTKGVWEGLSPIPVVTESLGVEHQSIQFQSSHISLCFCPECASQPRPFPLLGPAACPAAAGTLFPHVTLHSVWELGPLILQNSPPAHTWPLSDQLHQLGEHAL